MEKKTILQLDMKTLLDSVDISSYNFNYDHITDLVVFSEYACNRANEVVSGDKTINNDIITCHMLDQLSKALGNSEYRIDEILFILNFKRCKVSDYKRLRKMEGGIALTINKKIIKVVEFLKSNSMSRNARIYYINRDYYELLNTRLTFDLVKDNNVDIAKWYAYTGLTISDCIILNNIKLNKDEVVIVPDKEMSITFNNVITAISVTSLIEDVKHLKKLIENEKNYNEIINGFENYEVIKNKDLRKAKDIIYRFKEYRSSISFDEIKSNEMKAIIKTVVNYNNLSYYDYLQSLSELSNIKENNDFKVSWEMLRLEKLDSSVNCFDGEGLISLELERKINAGLKGESLVDNEDDYTDDLDYEDMVGEEAHSFQIRLPFIKGVVHSCDFKSFFKEHGIDKIKGKTYGGKDFKELREYDVDKVEMILTESQFKLAKFKELFVNITNKNEKPIDAYFRLLNKYDYRLGISNKEKHAKLDYVRLCYQFFSTMPLSKESIEHIRNSNIDYVNKITKPEYILDNLKATVAVADENNDSKSFDSLIEKYRCMIDAYSLSPEYVLNSYEFSNIRESIISKEINNTYLAKLDVKGARKYLSGDLLELLYHVLKLSGSDENIPMEEKIKSYNCYMPNTSYEHDRIPFVLLRNPHYARNEIKMLHPFEPNKNSDRARYLGHLTGVVMINPASDAADRLGGADYDGDTVIVTWDKAILNEIYTKLYKDNKELYPLIKIPSIKSQSVLFNYENRIKCMENTFNSSVGKISDICFLKTFDSYNDNRPDDIAFYTILNGLEIDSAKNGLKPVIEEDSLPNNKYSKFLELKNEFKNSKDGNTNSEKIKGLKKEINEESDLFFNVIKNPNINRVEKLPKAKLDRNKVTSLEDTRVIDLAAVTITYRLVIQAIDKYKKHKRFYNKSMEELIAKGNRILKANHTSYDFETFAKLFISSDYNSKLLEYLEDMPYYMQGKAKLEEINKLDLGKLDDDIINTVLNYNHDGFELLYLIIYYQREMNRSVIANIDLLYDKYKEKEGLECVYKRSLKNITNLDDRIKNMVTINITEIKEKLKEFDSYNGADYINKVNNFVEGYFRRLIRKYYWNDIEAIINFNQNNLDFTLFGNKLIAHLKEVNSIGSKN